ncbi:MAG: rhamnogalacturonan acetylesterase [Bacteroidota bacterium]|nr:rhamnogalacturonan acetylesterase [Bacteroidota bacterium]
MKTIKFLLIIALVSVAFTQVQHKPVLYIIGDSTVRNGDGTGRNGQVGWGSVIGVHFDSSKITVLNLAIGGRSSRTFITDGRWDKILETLQKDDFVIMQFGHNDSGKLDDTARARGTIKGIGPDSVEIYNPIRKMKEVVHTYGWYMRKYANDTKAKGAVPIICSPIPRNDWRDGKIIPTEYTGWAKQVAGETGTYYIDLNERIAATYEQMDTAKVRSFFPADHTHTNKEGAILNAQKVVDGIKDLKKCELKKYLNQGQG